MFFRSLALGLGLVVGLAFSISAQALSFVTIQFQVLDSSEQRELAEELRLPVMHSEANPDGSRSVYLGQFRDIDTAEAQLSLLKRENKLNWPKLAPFVVEMFPSTMGKPKQPKPVAAPSSAATIAPSPVAAPQNTPAEIERKVSELSNQPEPAVEDSWQTFGSGASEPAQLSSAPAAVVTPASVSTASSPAEKTGEASLPRYGIQAGAFKSGSNYNRFIDRYDDYPLVCRHTEAGLHIIYFNVFEGYSKAKAYLAEIEAATQLQPYIVKLGDVELVPCE